MLGKHAFEKPEMLQETRQLLTQSCSQFADHTYVNGRRYELRRGVFSPAIFPSTAYYANIIPLKRGDRFLEIGAGAGVIAIEQIYRGAKSALAADISKAAAKLIARNAKMHGLKHQVSVACSDVFDGIPQQEFDVIFWALPFGYVEKQPANLLSRTVFDYKYDSTGRYFSEAGKYLAKHGRLLFGFSKAIGTEEALDEKLRDTGWEKRLLDETILRECRNVDFGLYEAVATPCRNHRG